MQFKEVHCGNDRQPTPIFGKPTFKKPNRAFRVRPDSNGNDERDKTEGKR